MDIQGKDLVLYISASADWSGLYADGELVTVGHASDVQERIIDELGIELRRDDSFMLGTGKAAQKLRSVTEYEERRERAKDELAGLDKMREKLKRDYNL